MIWQLILIVAMIVMMTGLDAKAIDETIEATTDNSVVTGVRFGVENGSVCVQTKLNELTVEGVQESSGRWTPCAKPLETKVPFGPADIINIDIGHMIQVPECDTCFITDVILQLSNSCPGIPHFKLLVTFSKFNWTSGQLVPFSRHSSSRCQWLDSSACPCTLNDSPDFASFTMQDIDEAPLLIFDPEATAYDPPVPLTGISLTRNDDLNLLTMEIQSPFDETTRTIGGRYKRQLTSDDQLSSIHVYSSTTDSSPWYKYLWNNPEYIYIPALIVLAIVIFLICWFFKCITDCICACLCGRRRDIVVNNVAVMSPDRPAKQEIPHA